MSDAKYRKLLEPGYIGKVKINNRIIKTAQGSSMIEPDSGFIGDKALAYYENLIKGGIGLLIVESCGVEYPLGTHQAPVQFRLHDDFLIPSFQKLAEVSHRYSTPIFLQLIHSGPWNPSGLRNLTDARCSSTLTKDQLPGPDFVPTRALTPEEIVLVQEMFIKAAERAYKAGFDGVEINAATCTLPNSFLSRVFNQRTDRYGPDSLENRARFVTEIISGTRKRLPAEFAVTVILNIAEYGHPLATPIEEGVKLARLFQDAGAEAIEVRGHYYGHRDGLMHPDRFWYPEFPANPPKDLDWRHMGQGANLPLAAAVKKAGVSVPVFTASRFDPESGEKALAEGLIDFVGMTRRILADPELPRKVLEGRPEDIRPCLGCLYCMDVRRRNKVVTCRVNPQIGREREITLAPAVQKKKVMVIGAGPAGLETARVTAIRGHEVFLFDKHPRLGGLLPLTSLFRDVERADMLDLIKWFERQLNNLKVDLKLGREVNTSVVKAIRPDVIVLATGAKHAQPHIAGFPASGALTSSALHRQIKLALRVFSPPVISYLSRTWIPIGKRVIVIGGKIQGCETAEFLVKLGRQVTIVDGDDKFGEGMIDDDKQLLFPWFEKKGLTKHLGVKFNSISKRKLNITTHEGKNLTLKADTIITALPLLPDEEIPGKFKGLAGEVYCIGDCQCPEQIAEAMAAGAVLAQKL